MNNVRTDNICSAAQAVATARNAVKHATVEFNKYNEITSKKAMALGDAKDALNYSLRKLENAIA